jgi:hypothetical protein
VFGNDTDNEVQLKWEFGGHLIIESINDSGYTGNLVLENLDLKFTSGSSMIVFYDSGCEIYGGSTGIIYIDETNTLRLEARTGKPTLSFVEAGGASNADVAYTSGSVTATSNSIIAVEDTHFALTNSKSLVMYTGTSLVGDSDYVRIDPAESGLNIYMATSTNIVEFSGSTSNDIVLMPEAGNAIVIGDSGSIVGAYGSSGTSQQVLATGTGATVDDVITALQAIGWVKQS